MLARLIALMTIVLPVGPQASAAPPAGTAFEAFVVHVSILPQVDLAARIAGPRASVRTLVPVGQSPHSFELTPKQMSELAESRAFFGAGLPFEKQVLERLIDMNPSLLVVDTSEGIARRPTDVAHAHREEERREDGQGLPDPHVWLNPRFAAVMAERMREGFVAIDPDGARAYDANLALLLDDLRRLDESVALMLEPHAGRSFYVFHPAFGYFADRYGLIQVPMESGGKEPSIRELIAFMDSARADGATTVFAQLQFPVRATKAVAEEIGATVVPLDPLDPDYLGGIRRLAEALRAALEPAALDVRDSEERE